MRAGPGPVPASVDPVAVSLLPALPVLVLVAVLLHVAAVTAAGRLLLLLLPLLQLLQSRLDAFLLQLVWTNQKATMGGLDNVNASTASFQELKSYHTLQRKSEVGSRLLSLFLTLTFHKWT